PDSENPQEDSSIGPFSLYDRRPWSAREEASLQPPVSAHRLPLALQMQRFISTRRASSPPSAASTARRKPHARIVAGRIAGLLGLLRRRGRDRRRLSFHLHADHAA